MKLYEVIIGWVFFFLLSGCVEEENIPVVSLDPYHVEIINPRSM